MIGSTRCYELGNDRARHVQKLTRATQQVLGWRVLRNSGRGIYIRAEIRVDQISALRMRADEIDGDHRRDDNDDLRRGVTIVKAANTLIQSLPDAARQS